MESSAKRGPLLQHAAPPPPWGKPRLRLRACLTAPDRTPVGTTSPRFNPPGGKAHRNKSAARPQNIDVAEARRSRVRKGD